MPPHPPLPQKKIFINLNRGLYAEAAEQAKRSTQPLRAWIEELVEAGIAARRANIVDDRMQATRDRRTASSLDDGDPVCLRRLGYSIIRASKI